MKKIVSIIIIGFFISCSFGVQGLFFENRISEPNFENECPLFVDYLQPPLYKRSLQDIISGKALPSLEGTRPLLVILTNYKDQDMNVSHDIEYYTDFMWGPRPSLSDYFLEVSYGKFTYSQAGVLGWYKIDVIGSWAENLTNNQEFVIEAVTAADEDFDYAAYDIDHDGVVTNEELTLVIVHPADSCKVLCWEWYTRQKIETNDDVLVEGVYSFIGEWCWMGYFAHELCHDIGLPDLYDTNKDSNGVGCYGLMSHGYRYGPTHLTAWCKIQLGWLTPTVITTNGTYTLNDVETHAEALIVCDLNHSASEYFLIENRYRGTSYDSLNIGEWWSPSYVDYLSNLSDEGILISHIDDSKASPWWNNRMDTVNVKEEHKGVDVECADSPSSHFIDADDLDSMENDGDDTDLWDITTYDFNDFSSPCNATFYDGKPSGCTIGGFSAIGPTMTMSISIKSQVENHPPTNLSITGQESGKARTPYEYSYVAKDPENQYIRYYIEWGDGLSTGWIGPEKSGSTQKITHSWVEKGTYLIRMKARDSFGAESDWVTLSVTMPYSINTPIPRVFEKFFQRFPHTFPLLRHLMGN